jgi:hypothetical protein
MAIAMLEHAVKDLAIGSLQDECFLLVEVMLGFLPDT